MSGDIELIQQLFDEQATNKILLLDISNGIWGSVMALFELDMSRFSKKLNPTMINLE